MTDPLRLMCVLAHPDDESLGTGGILAKYAAEGVETFVVTATRGERGWWGDEKDYPGVEGLGKIREAELLAAAKVLGVRRVDFLDYVDGDLDQANPAEAIAKIVSPIRREKPHVVITFDPVGAYGHPDHIAICQFTNAAIVSAADPAYVDPAHLPPHRVSKLYYMADTQALIDAYVAVFGDVVMTIDGVERRPGAWPDWAVTSRIDCTAHWPTVWQAIACHRSQLPGYSHIKQWVDSHDPGVFGHQTYYRAFSVINGGRRVETDLFEGLR
ncbi:MAG TPA: PIG-L deacetylase family protein [Anaerolineae bacterium]|nr:PIG-L deacetylase family protein [Anaerolineae bacterium]